MRRAFRPSAVFAFLFALVIALAAPGSVRASTCDGAIAPVAAAIAMAPTPDHHTGKSDRADHHGCAGHCAPDGLCCASGCALAEPLRLVPPLPRVSHVRGDLSDRAIHGVAVLPALGPPRSVSPT